MKNNPILKRVKNNNSSPLFPSLLQAARNTKISERNIVTYFFII